MTESPLFDQLRSEVAAAANRVSPPRPVAAVSAPVPATADLSMVTRQTHADIRLVLMALDQVNSRLGQLAGEVAVIRARLGT